MLVGIIFILGIVIFLTAMLLCDGEKISKRSRNGALIFCAVCAIFMLTTPFYLEYADKNKPVITFDESGNPRFHDWVAYCPGACLNFSETNPTNGFPPEVHGTVISMTQNPKLRKISYDLRVHVISPERYARRFWSEITKNGVQEFEGVISRESFVARFRGLVQYYIYEFNNKNSIEMSAIYNPLDPEQRDRLAALIDRELNPLLEPHGLSASLARFRVE